MMAKLVYIFSALTSIVCMILLFRAFFLSRLRLLMWSGICFAGLTVNNLLLVVDLIVFPGPEIDLSMLRLITGTVSLAVLVFGLIWESR